MSDENSIDEFVPTVETNGKSFQVDKCGNYRIVVKNRESLWYGPYEIATLKIDNENGTSDVFFALSNKYRTIFPTECVLKAVIVDDDGDSDFYQFKIVNLVKNEILDADDVLCELTENTSEQDYFICVKDSRHDDYVKIKITEIAIGLGDQDQILNKDDIADFLVRTLDKHKFDIYDFDHTLINDCPGCDICLKNRYLGKT